MNIRDAILKAADHIERQPREFAFSSYVLPSGPSCGTPGCAIGWIASFRGVEPDTEDQWGKAACAAAIRASEPEFYERMDQFNPDWDKSAAKCASAMRLYADKYHPAEVKPDAKWVRQDVGSWDVIGFKPSVRA